MKTLREVSTAKPTFVCKYTKIEFSGVCPVSNCHANIYTDFKQIEQCPSGCVFEIFGDKQLSSMEISYVFGISQRQAATNIKNGITKMSCALQIRDMFSAVKEEKAKYCPLCFFLKENALECLNKIKCNQRIEFFNSISRTFPFNIKEFYFKQNLWKFIMLGMNYKSFSDICKMLCLTEDQIETVKILINKER